VKIRPSRSSTSIRWWFIKIFIALPLYGLAQLHQNERLEIPISFDYESFEVASVKNFGIILYRAVGNELGKQFEIIHTDTSFHEKWRGHLSLEKGFDLARHISANGNLYFIFYNRNFSDRSFILYEISLTHGTYTKFIVRNSIPFLPIAFEVNTKGALIGGYFNQTPLVVFFEFNTQKSKILPGLFNEAGELAQIKINADDSFNVLISAKNYQKQQTLWLKNYDPVGGLKRNIMLHPGDNNHLIFGRTIQINPNSLIVTGVYGGRNSDYSRGLFVANISNEGMQQIKYYSYADLKNFFKYMRVKQEKRVKDRIERKKIKGKKIRFQYRFLVHELVPYKNQFILLGEAFYPKYRQAEGYVGLGRTSYIFDGYRYTHAVVLGIDTHGELLWDNSFEINDVKSFMLEQFVKMDAKKDEIALLYLYDNKIRTKVIRDSTVLEGKSSNQLQLKAGSNPVSENTSTVNKLDYWYDDYFLAYGVQNIGSSSLQGRNKKKIFFVSKVSYE
jgi:hypothetical protein